MATGAWQTMASGLPEARAAVSSLPESASFQRSSMGTVATGVVHGVVVLQAGVSQFDRSAQLFCGAQDILQVAGDLFTASHRWPQAHHVDVGHHSAGMATTTSCPAPPSAL